MFKNGHKEIIEDKFEECLVDWPNEPYTENFNMSDDYQYNHSNDRVFIRLRYTNFPWVPIEELGPFYSDERILDNIFYDMLGILDPSEYKVKLNTINLFEALGFQGTSNSLRQIVPGGNYSASEEIGGLISKLQSDGAISTGRHFILACKRATEFIPEDPNNWWNYGKSLELQEKLDEAIKMYAKASELTPTNPRIWRILGETYLKRKQALIATDCFKKAICYLENFNYTDKYQFVKNLEKETSALERNLINLAIPEEIKNLLYNALIPIYTKLNNWKKVGWAFFKIGKIEESINSFRTSLNDIFESDFIIQIENRLKSLNKYLNEISFTEYPTICKIIIEHLKSKLDIQPSDPRLRRLIMKHLVDCGSEKEILETFQICINTLEGLYDKKIQDAEKLALIKLFHDTKFAYLIPQIEKIQIKKQAELFRSFDGPRYIKTLKFSPNNKFIVAGGQDKQINIWNVETGELSKTLETNPTNQVTFSTDGKYLSISGKKIQIWDVDKEQIAFVLDGHKKGRISTSFTPNGKFLISASIDDGTIKLWDLFQKNVLWNHIIVKSGDFASNFQFDMSFYGKIVAYTNENRITILDIDNGKVIKQYNGGSPIEVASNGQHIAFPYDETTLFIADIKTGTPIKILQGHSFQLHSLKFSPQDELIIGGESSKYHKGCTIYIWNVSTGKLVKTLQGHSGSVWALDCSQDGRYLASGDWDKKIKIWIISPSDDDSN